MSILCDTHLLEMLNQLIPNELERSLSLVNSASIDVRIGKTAKKIDSGLTIDLTNPQIIDEGLSVFPGQFLLVATFERIHVPNEYAVDLRLKSSSARKGWNHSLAFWVDPGWDGYLTMEIQNVGPNVLQLKYGERFSQIIVHELTGKAAKPYCGRYQNANLVEGAK